MRYLSISANIKKKIQTVPLPDPGAYIVLKKKKITKMDDIVRLA